MLRRKSPGLGLMVLLFGGCATVGSPGAGVDPVTTPGKTIHAAEMTSDPDGIQARTHDGTAIGTPEASAHSGMASSVADGDGHTPALPFIQDDYPRALQEARARGLPLFVEAWADW